MHIVHLVICLMFPVKVVSITTQAIPLAKAHNDRQLELQQENPVEAFEQWMLKHNRDYVKDSAEWHQRFENWVRNLVKAVNYNRNQNSHWMTMTGLADMHEEEVERYSGVLAVPEEATELMSSDVEEVDLTQLPRRVDWRQRGVVTPPKDQGECGACWAFSATGSIEALHAMTTGELVSLSEQELIDCDYLDNGCSGGYMETAFQWAAENGGISNAKQYAYTASTNTCAGNKLSQPSVSIDGFRRVPATEKHLVEALSKRPISVAVNGEHSAFYLYGGGIFDIDCASELTHAMLAVGYDLDEGYILLRNSWGANWGEDGYVRLALNKNGEEGQCGVAMLASYPVMNGNEADESPETSPSTPQEPQPKPDARVRCDAKSYCNSGESCCCMKQLLGVCSEWGCCPAETSVCCTDQQYCCPEEYPICGSVPGTCTNNVNSIAAVRRRLTSTDTVPSMPKRHRMMLPAI